MIFQPILPWWLLLAIFLAIAVGSTLLIIKQPGRRLEWLRRISLVAVLLIAMLRPSVPGYGAEAGNSSLDVYFVVDTTVSASAEDYDGNKPRIEGMRQDIKSIAKELAGAKYTLIQFDNTARLVMPLSNDASALSTAVDIMATNSEYSAKGSTIDRPLELLDKELKQKSSSENTSNRSKLVFYLGDGEQTVDNQPASFAKIKPLISGGAVLGYGTKQGGKMVDTSSGDDADERYRYIKDYSDMYQTRDALSVIDETNLNSIAKQIGVQYYHREKPDSTNQITTALKVSDITSANKTIEHLYDLYWLLMPVFLILLLFDAILHYRALSLARVESETKR